MKILTILSILCILSGCASTNFVQTRTVSVDGRPMTYVFGQSCNHTGLQMVVVDRYSDGQLIARDYGVGEGIMQKIIPAAVHGGLMAGGMMGTAVLLRPDETSVTQNGSGNVSASLSSNSTSDSSSQAQSNSESTSNSLSIASQTQGQSQGQVHGQSQSNLPWSKKKVKPCK